MKIHEYQAKEIFKSYGIPVPNSRVVSTPDEAMQAAKEIGFPVAVKAQIHAGGRGKAGGIKISSNPEEVLNYANELLGKQLITHQTGPQGQKVNKLLIEESLNVKKELYLGIIIDRSQAMPVIMFSEAGGMEIEEIASRYPEKIIKVAVDPAIGFCPFHARKLLFGSEIDGTLLKDAQRIIKGLFSLFREKDASLVEINPLVVTKDNKILALDAKINFDDDGLFRHPEIKELYDPDQLDPLEVEASKYRINYIKLDGNVGCMVNGAGLAMATMDLIKLAGQEPANFLDVGGGASAEQVENAFRILISDKKVKIVLINIFGGILRCDRVATGIVEAARKIKIELPMVVRLEGTNVDEGRKILQNSGLRFEVASTFEETALKIAELAKGGKN